MGPPLSPLRSGRITGSRVGAILGVSPYASRSDVLREMVRRHAGEPDEFQGNIATSYGVEHEDEAIAAYEQLRAVMTHSGQRFVIHPEYPFLGVSPDGLVGDDGLVEVKCPYRGKYLDITERPDYEAQVRLQLECTQRAWADFVVWSYQGIAVSRVMHDPEWLPSIMDELTGFLDEYTATITDPELAAPHLVPLVDQRTDEEWQLAATDYLDALVELKAAERTVAAARDTVLRLSDGRPVRGHGVSVSHSQRRGSVDMKAAVAALAPTADLESYRGEGRTVSTVRAVALDRER